MLKKLIYALKHTRAASLHATHTVGRGFNNAEREKFYIRV